MLNLNKNKLIPATEIISYWGEIKGDISKQTDLVELTTDLDTSIKGWVEGKGYLTEHQDLSSYALKTEIPSLTGYATESWVQSQGYLTEHQDLSGYALKTEIPSLTGYATEQWVEGKGYLTSHQDLTGYAQKSEIEPLYNKYKGYLKYDPAITYLEGMSNAGFTFKNINNNSLKNLVNTIDDKVYAYNPSENKFFRFNIETFSFDEYSLTSYGTIPTQIFPMWSDSQGRVYYGNKFIFIISDDYKTVDMISQDLGGDFQEHTGTIKSNIIKKDGVIYMISSMNARAYIFNEETQNFDSSIPVQGKFPSTTFYRYLSEFEGHWIYDVGKEQTELVFHLDGAEPYAEWVTLSERLFPGAWSYEYEGKTINETTRGVFIHPVVKNGVTEYYTFGYANPVMYKLVNGAWEIVGYNQTVSDMLTNAGGCACGTLWFGFAYLKDMANHLIIWNMDDSAAGRPEFYNWYDLDSKIEGINNEIVGINNEIGGINNEIKIVRSQTLDNKAVIGTLDSRISALETNYGDALNITNQILG